MELPNKKIQTKNAQEKYAYLLKVIKNCKNAKS